ncbi:Uncharacterised protein (plasmid) [Tsukamurella tyrosinosolvens]|uniref:Uncharacterized protein n=1 Tax=Tsukamurella tyrosinosolvens TaxID=57704 RepID=A0A1H4V6N1_TSUTY|nr:hypothetical protein [Tsukamurella tyrosinosolvens]SEC76576.1 hypothetical protein SAMN04489793_3157 [Tsukamurella tyrosinosolvens]VEH90656.1 Uncharacterised protein [Tsukamurella tyrosinosolvens]
MAISINELRRWLDTLEEDTVAMDEGGLCLVEIEPINGGTDMRGTGAYLEVGGF